jgi:hypothetical protein
VSKRRTTVLIALITALLLAVALFGRPGVRGRLWRMAVRNPTLAVQAKPFEAMLVGALNGYNSDDASALFRDFAADALPPPNAETHQSLFRGFHRKRLGKYVSHQLNFEETTISAEAALVVLRATFSQQPHVAVSANFVRQAGTFKIKQLRLEENEALSH